MKTLYYAEFKYKKNVFRSVSFNRIATHQILFRSVRLWCEANGVKANPILKIVDEQRYEMHVLEIGFCYVNSVQIGMREV